jgi:hypothetical protein
MEGKCILGNAGVFVGLVDIPLGHEVEFYEAIFYDPRLQRGMFFKYQEELKKNFKQAGEGQSDEFKEFENYFYIPRPYSMFGEFDLGIISLIDDFEFSCRTFHSYDPIIGSAGDKLDRRGFAHQVIVGPFPRFSHGPESDPVELAKRTFLAAQFPLIGICQLKLNNALLIGEGSNLLRATINYIKSAFNEVEYSNTELLILESYSWNEITLLVFSDSYLKIVDFLLNSVREKTVGEVYNFFLQRKNALDAQLKAENDPARREKFKNAIDQYQNLANVMNKAATIDIENWANEYSHLFQISATYLGFDFQIFKDFKEGNTTSSLYNKISPDDFVYPIYNWTVKAGHLKDTANILGATGDVSIRPGKRDLIFPRSDRPLSTKAFINEFLELQNKRDLSQHALSSVTIVAKDIIPSTEAVHSDHHFLRSRLNKLSFEFKEIEELSETMTGLGIPKIIAQRVINAISNYNEGITDQALYLYFIELRHFIERLIDTVVAYKTRRSEIDQLNNILTESIDCFEKGYRNRFYSGYRLSDITDFNLEFKGGIQQLVSSFDIAFKTISQTLGAPGAFVFVGGDPGVGNTEIAISLNYSHIFQPENFAAIATHEVGNQFLRRKKPYRYGRLSSEAFMLRDPTAAANIENAIDDLFDTFRKQSKRFYLPENAIRGVFDHFTPKFFDDIFADYISYYFGYYQDASLFDFWSWNHFITLPGIYQNTNQLNAADVLKLLIRVLTVLRFCNLEFFEKYFESGAYRHTVLFAPIETPYDIILVRNRYDVPGSIRHLFATIKEFFDHDLYYEGSPFTKWNEAVKDFVEGEFNTIFRNFSKKTRDDIIKDIILSFQNGDVYPYDDFIRSFGKEVIYHYPEDLRGFFYIHCLLYAYHCLIKAEVGGKATLLWRNPGTGTPQIGSGESPYLFDQRGGTFVCKPAVRKSYFMYRCALTMSLWDYAHKKKASQISRLV